jgi:hypothetical protein
MTDHSEAAAPTQAPLVVPVVPVPPDWASAPQAGAWQTPPAASGH